MTLRQYQADVIDNARQALERSGSVVIQMPTGAGKTKVATSMIADQECPVWFICHRQEIERQAASSFARAGIDFGVVSPRADPDYSKPVQIVSHGTLARRINDLPHPSTVFWDECHHVAAKSWSAIRERLSDAKHIGLTATPERLDGKGLSNWFDELTVGPSTRELIDEGYLSEFRYFAPSDPDLSAARVQAGDYAKKDLASVMNTPVLIGDAVREYKEKATGKRALVFAASVDMSKALVDRFNENGIPARHIDGKTPTDERDAAVQALASGAVKVLSNVEVFTEGFDLPAIDAVILMRPTKSLALFLQMIGRALRKAEGKHEALIFDHAGLWLDHGWFDAPIEWSLDGDARKRRLHLMGDGRLRRCPKCKEVRSERIEVCNCGYEFPSGREIGEFDGQLHELCNAVPDGMATVSAFAKRHCTSTGGIASWCARGLPRRAGFIPIDEGDAWVYANVNLSDPRRRAPHHTSGEYETQAAFARRIGVGVATVSRWIKEGLPNKDKWVNINEGTQWAGERLPPDGAVSIAEYAKSKKLSAATIQNWIRSGMPACLGLRPIMIIPTLADEWIIKKDKGVDLRMSICRKPDSGWETRAGFAKLIGVAAGTITEWKTKGLPTNDFGHINIDDGVTWVAENSWKAGFGTESQSMFAARLSVSQASVSAWKAKGLPCVKSGWVSIQRGLEWVRDNTGIKIPPEAWPFANNNDLPTKQAA